MLSVVKKGGVREPFDREKIRAGLAIACGKRPVAEETIEEIVSAVERECHDAFETEIASRAIGERVMELLRGIDQVAYVRFASVYREFKDARDFVQELEPILAGDRTASPAPAPADKAVRGALAAEPPAPAGIDGAAEAGASLL